MRFTFFRRLVVVAGLAVCLILPASATELDVGITGQGQGWKLIDDAYSSRSTTDYDWTLPLSNRVLSLPTPKYANLQAVKGVGGESSLSSYRWSDTTLYYDGPVQLSLSGYYYGRQLWSDYYKSTVTVSAPTRLTATLSWYDNTGVLQTAPATVTTWATGLSSALDGAEGIVYAQYGITISARWSGSSIDPVHGLSVTLSDHAYYVESVLNYYSEEDGWSPSHSMRLTSVRAVGTESSAELDGLTEIADSITAQSEMMQAYYGDILAVAQAIQSDTQDLVETAKLMQSYYSQLIELVDSIDRRTDSIYELLSANHDALLSALESHTSSITGAVSDAELRLETYLKPLIEYLESLETATGESATTIPGHKTDLDGWANTDTGIPTDVSVPSWFGLLIANNYIQTVLLMFVGVGVVLVLLRKGMS